MLVGAATIILTIPFTAFISALMLSGKGGERKERKPEKEFVIDGGGEIGRKTVYTK